MDKEQEINEMKQALAAIAETARNPEDKSRFDRDMQTFIPMFRRYLTLRDHPGSEFVDWSTISPPFPDSLVDTSSLPSVPLSDIKTLLSKLAVVKLNGGLGTTMGCTGPKCFVEAHAGACFLDLIVDQLAALNTTYGVDVPLVLLCSFNTYFLTLPELPKLRERGVRIFAYLQSTHPRFDAETLKPVADKLYADDSHWYPPGHAEVFPYLFSSGVAAQLQAEGREYIFVSNTDNLGALVEPRLLARMERAGTDFAMEVTPKTALDVKGGTPVANTKTGKGIRLLEIAQVAPEHKKDFEGLETFPYFNTNNMWVRISAMEQVVKAGKIYSDLDIIVNRKEYNGRTVIQLEVASGACIGFFEKSCAFVVPRSRFLLVKGCQDLMLLRSDLFSFDHGTATLNPKRKELLGTESLPRISLDKHYKMLKDFLAHFPEGMPSIVELKSLTIKGNIYFGKNITLKGDVVLTANDSPSETHMPDNITIGSF